MTHKDQQESGEVLIYKNDRGETVVDVHLINESVWLSLNQISKLFGRDKSVISRHLKNVFNEGELDKESTVAFFATVQNESGRHVERNIEHFNLDAILSVGYRVNSKEGTRFRKWTSKVLQDYLIGGYAINTNSITDQKIRNLENAIDLLSRTLIDHTLTNDLGVHVIKIIRNYSRTWTTLLEYDENRLISNISKEYESHVVLEVSQVRKAISDLKMKLIEKREASSLFGLEKTDALEGILGSISQTFDGIPVYPTHLERASHLLYFIIKDHPFSDGNKRIGCLLFLIYISQSDLDLSKIDDNALTALALLIAESHPSQKDTMIHLVIKLFSQVG